MAILNERKIHINFHGLELDVRCDVIEGTNDPVVVQICLGSTPLHLQNEEAWPEIEALIQEALK